MIKVNRNPKPLKLTTALQRKLTETFKDKKTAVWNKPYIKQALLEMSHRKCVYCEVVVGEEAKYMEVEHYYPKEAYPDYVVAWENLLPSCKRCNGKKGTYDPKTQPFLNPVLDFPKNHLRLKKAGRVSGMDAKGRASVERLGLNDYDMIRRPRLKIINDVQQRIKDLRDEMQHRLLKEDERFQRKAQRKIQAILLGTMPRSAYSAYVASVILSNHNFNEIVKQMKREEVWTDPLERLYLQAAHAALEKST